MANESEGAKRLTEEIVEEHEDNLGTGVEADQEDEDDDQDFIRPWDPKAIRVDPKQFSIRQILDQIKDKELDLTPDFQRRRVWKPRQKSLLIESLLLRIPLPAFYFNADEDGVMQVVDGVQRLSTISEFVSGDSFPLRDLEYLEELDGKTFKDIEGSIWSRRILQTQIICNVIDPQTPDAVKFDIFRRINTGGTPLSAQEIRHCMTKERSRKYLQSLAALKSFAASTDNALKNHVRMVDREVVLRFCAFHFLDELSAFSKFDSIDDFLTRTAKNIDDPQIYSDSDLNEVKLAFDRSMSNCSKLFGRQSFRKTVSGSDRRMPINRALFDVWSVLLAEFEWDEIQPQKGEILSRYQKLLNEESDFWNAITVGTSSPAKVRLRFSKIKGLLGEVGL